MLDLALKDAVAIITGGSDGLGRAAAQKLASEGARVAICALDDPSLPAAKKEIEEAAGGEVIAIAADVSDVAQASHFVRAARDHFGTIDILVNNAGGPPSTSFLEIDDKLWEHGFRLNLMSTIAMTREAVPTMKDKRTDRPVNAGRMDTTIDPQSSSMATSECFDLAVKE